MPNIDTETQLTAQESGFLLTGDMDALVDSTVSCTDDSGVTEGIRESMSSIINSDKENYGAKTEKARKAEQAKRAEEARGYLKQYLVTASPDDRALIVKKIIQTQDVEAISKALDETSYNPGNPVVEMLINALVALKSCPALVENFAYMTRGTSDFDLVINTVAKYGTTGEVFALMQLVTAGTLEDTILAKALADRGTNFDELTNA